MTRNCRVHCSICLILEDAVPVKPRPPTTEIADVITGQNKPIRASSQDGNFKWSYCCINIISLRSITFNHLFNTLRLINERAFLNRRLCVIYPCYSYKHIGFLMLKCILIFAHATHCLVFQLKRHLRCILGKPSPQYLEYRPTITYTIQKSLQLRTQLVS